MIADAGQTQQPAKNKYKLKGNGLRAKVLSTPPVISTIDFPMVGHEYSGTTAWKYRTA